MPQYIFYVKAHTCRPKLMENVNNLAPAIYECEAEPWASYSRTRIDHSHDYIGWNFEATFVQCLLHTLKLKHTKLILMNAPGNCDNYRSWDSENTLRWRRFHTPHSSCCEFLGKNYGSRSLLDVAAFLKWRVFVVRNFVAANSVSKEEISSSLFPFQLGVLCGIYG